MRPERPDIAGYRILRRLGHGGMSEIWLAEQVALARPVAVKVVNAGEEGEERLARFRQEAAIVARFDHPNVVGIIEFGQAGDGRLFFSMPYVPGGTLAQAAISGDGARTREVLAQLLDALEYIHGHGVVHRDVKPENVLFDSVGRPRLADFGVSRSIAAASRHTRAGETFGSIHYMSPEQARGELPDGRSDLYSLGAIAFELLTGSPPFQGPDDISIVVGHLQSPLPALPDHLAQWRSWLARALAKRPADRFPDAAAMRAALLRIPATPRAAWLSPRAREALLHAGLPAITVLALGVLAGWLWMGPAQDSGPQPATASVTPAPPSPAAGAAPAPARMTSSGPQPPAATPGGAPGDPAATASPPSASLPPGSSAQAEPVPASAAATAPALPTPGIDAAASAAGRTPGQAEPQPEPGAAAATAGEPAPSIASAGDRPALPAAPDPASPPVSVRSERSPPTAARTTTGGSAAAPSRASAVASRPAPAVQPRGDVPAALPVIGGFEQVPTIPLLLLSGSREQQLERLDAWLSHGRSVIDADRGAVARARRASSDRAERASLQAGLDQRRANYERWRRQVLALRRQVDRQS